MAHVGIFGPTLCGKTTLAKTLAAQYAAAGRLSVALLAFPDNWGRHTWTTTDQERFREKVFSVQNCAVFIEEAASTIARDRDFMPFFTRIRHQGHRLHVIGHSGTDLLPGMRNQLTTLFLFRQPPDACEIWARTFCDRRLLTAADLPQYWFLHATMFGDVVRRTLKV